MSIVLLGYLKGYVATPHGPGTKHESRGCKNKLKSSKEKKKLF